jgi:hypothetical protein
MKLFNDSIQKTCGLFACKHRVFSKLPHVFEAAGAFPKCSDDRSEARGSGFTYQAQDFGGKSYDLGEYDVEKNR